MQEEVSNAKKLLLDYFMVGALSRLGVSDSAAANNLIGVAACLSWVLGEDDNPVTATLHELQAFALRRQDSKE